MAPEVLLLRAHLQEQAPLFRPPLPLPLLLLPLELPLLHLEHPAFLCRVLEVLLPIRGATSNLASPHKDPQGGHLLNLIKGVPLPKGILEDLRLKGGLHNMVATHRLLLSSNMVDITGDPQDLEVTLDTRASQEGRRQVRDLHNKGILDLLDLEDHQMVQHQALGVQEGLLELPASLPGIRIASLICWSDLRSSETCTLSYKRAHVTNQIEIHVLMFIHGQQHLACCYIIHVLFKLKCCGYGHLNSCSVYVYKLYINCECLTL